MSTNLQQLNFENQRGSAWNHRRMPVVPVGDVGRADQSGLPADPQFICTPSVQQRMTPLSRELRWLIPLVRTNELCSVDQCPPIVHLHRIGGIRGGTGSGLDINVD